MSFFFKAIWYNRCSPVFNLGFFAGKTRLSVEWERWLITHNLKSNYVHTKSDLATIYTRQRLSNSNDISLYLLNFSKQGNSQILLDNVKRTIFVFLSFSNFLIVSDQFHKYWSNRIKPKWKIVVKGSTPFQEQSLHIFQHHDDLPSV